MHQYLFQFDIALTAGYFFFQSIVSLRAFNADLPLAKYSESNITPVFFGISLVIPVLVTIVGCVLFWADMYLFGLFLLIPLATIFYAMRFPLSRVESISVPYSVTGALPRVNLKLANHRGWGSFEFWLLIFTLATLYLK